MDNGMIGKIEKAKKYAAQRDRFRIQSLNMTFEGDNNPHKIELNDGAWKCDCDFFLTRGRCSHTMALEKIFDGFQGIPEPVS